VHISEGSADQYVASKVRGTKIVKRFNTFGYSSIGSPFFKGVKIDNFVAGDDLASKKKIIG